MPHDTKKLDEQIERDGRPLKLRAAQTMPGVAKRIEALRQAGQLRYDADKRMQANEQEMNLGKEAPRGG